ncbi:S8 family serine peptidase [Planctomycetaceae bacterium SH139]
MTGYSLIRRFRGEKSRALWVRPSHSSSAKQRRARLEQLVQRQLLAADLTGLQAVETLSSATNTEVAADIDLSTPQRTKAWLEAARSQPQLVATHDHWLLSWSEELDTADQYGPSVVTSIEAAPLIQDAFLVRFQQAFSAVEAQQHLGLAEPLELAYPLIARQLTTRSLPNDALFPEQWHLLNDGSQAFTVAGEDANVTPVWADYLGSGIVVSVIDDGLEYTHPDLEDRYRPDLSFDYNDNEPDPFANPFSEPHGTAVAGVIAASHNNSIGVTGAAPLSDLAFVRLLGASTSDLQDATALNHALSDVDIYNNSWGPVDSGQLNAIGQPGPLAAAALENGVLNGRGGLGVIYVWAGGNGAEIDDNVNYDRYANSRHTIAVGAVGADGLQSPYSEPGAPLLVVAPSSNDNLGITTTDIFDVLGYSTTDYTSEFGGTSSAAPLVSGVVALMLEANPNLSYRDVQHVLVNSARQNDPDDIDWEMNGAGKPVNHKYGFGTVDAMAAVELAETWENVGPEVSWTTGVITTDLAIPDDDAVGVNVDFKVPVNFQLEYVEVKLATTHEWSGDLVLNLTSPAGTTSQLTDLRLNDAAEFTFNNPLTSARHWDEWTFGDWSLNISDQLAVFEGDVDEIQVTLYGREIQSDVPLLSVADVSVPENRTFMDFLVSIPAPISEDITFAVDTMDDTAQSFGIFDQDYVAMDSVQFTIPAGSTSVVVPVQLINDTVEEPDESFWLALTDPVNARVPFDAVVGTIINDDVPGVFPAETWDFLAPKGSLVARSLNNLIEVENDLDLKFLTFEGQQGMPISFLAELSNQDATLRLELFDEVGDSIAGPWFSPGAGASIRLDDFVLPEAGIHSLRVTADLETDVIIDLYSATIIEAWDGDTSIAAPRALDRSVFGTVPSRFAVLGTLEEQPLEFNLLIDEAPNFFVDISETGTPLDLVDDGVAQITTTIGNSLMPAGDVRISNNGVIVSGTTGIPNYVNSRIPTNSLNTFLAPFWDDLTDSTGNVYWEEVVIDDVPTLIVQWQDRMHFNLPTGEGVTFQAQIYPDDGSELRVRYVYNDITFGTETLNFGASATIGAQVNPQSFFGQFSHNQVIFDDGEVLEIRSPTEVDSYTLDLTDAGNEEIDIILAGLDGTTFTNLSLELYGPGDLLYATGSVNPANINVENYTIGIPNFQVTAPGIYRVEISDTAYGDYMLLVTRSGVFDTEDNDVGSPELRKLSPVTGAIGALADELSADPDPVDFYEFEMTVDDRVILETMTPYDASGMQMSNLLDPRMEIYDSKDNLLVEDSGSAADGKNGLIRFIAPADGTYRVAVRAESGEGNYIVQTSEWVNNVPAGILLAPNVVFENTDTSAEPLLIGSLSTDDADGLDEHVYELVSGKGDVDNGTFTIVGDQLFLNQGEEIDFEAQDSYLIRVQSTDSFGDTVTEELKIDVINRGEVETIIVGTGSQRSRVEQVTVIFDSAVAIDPNAFEVTKRGVDGGSVEVSFTTMQDAENRTVATLSFAGEFFVNNSLVDGNYELRVVADQIRDSLGNDLDGDRDGTPGGDLVFGAEAADGFFRHFGDTTGDRVVDLSDFLRFRQAFNSAAGDVNYFDPVDFNDDEVINLVDFLAFRQRFGTELDFE